MKPAPAPLSDPAYDVLRAEHQPLDAFFAPRSVAVIGATERPGSVGRSILWNLLSSPFGGTVFPVNPARPSVLGIKAYPAVGAVPEKVDLAVVVTPAATVPAVIGDCVDAGVRAAIIISAGFKEVGEQGAELERRVLDQARRGRLRIIGPNCLGLMSPFTGLNATFAHDMARPGKVAFVSQSGALCTAILDWSLKEMVGFSAFVSVGSMLDVGWGDLIYYLGDDTRTESIVLYMESIGDAGAFLSAAREVALSKPIIVIKAGRTEQAARAAASHTGALTGSDEVLDAAFRRSGVLRVRNIADLFYMAEVLSKQPRPRGPRLAIVSNAGGPAVLATDALIAGGGELAPLAPETLKAMDEFLPPHWSHNNPIDILGDADAQRYARALEVASRDPNTDGMLVVMAPQAMTDPTGVAELLKPLASSTGKPVLASWMGGAEVSGGEAILNRSGIPTFPYPDTAARAFNYMWRYSYNLRGLYETPVLRAESGSEPDRARAAEMVAAARRAGRTLLTEFESKQVLAAYGIPTVETRVARSPQEARELAESLGYPVVVKLHSETVTHKTDVDGVKLNLGDGDAVERAWREIESAVRKKAGEGHFLGVTVQPMVRTDGYELILGSSLDPQFGPVLLFGAGGQLVEVFRDRALALPPLNTTLALRMMEQTKIFAALKGVRGRAAVDLDALEQLLVRFGQLVVEQAAICEIDINPLLASPERLLALDARVVVHPREVSDERLPRPAIRPYPSQYVAPWRMGDGTEIVIRPIRPEDEPLMVWFHQTLSERSVYLRYFQQLQLAQRVSHERLTRICFVDYDREMALVAEKQDGHNGQPEIIAVGRLSKLHLAEEGEVAFLVSDQYQHHGVGTELLQRLIQVGRDEKLRRILAYMLPENRAMQRVCEKLGFRLRPVPDEPLIVGELDL
ncbi:MAG TPA: bifunctional acetate--CoA ligase family protein/GNAT family N-acetyltransferase [Terriglobales bacterium]|nr:bifunctional acetate--CoA ligase family protein/GNAT family N-acetyltransferase [Terriglobales bacterium]